MWNRSCACDQASSVWQPTPSLHTVPSALNPLSTTSRVQPSRSPQPKTARGQSTHGFWFVLGETPLRFRLSAKFLCTHDGFGHEQLPYLRICAPVLFICIWHEHVAGTMNSPNANVYAT